MSHYLTDTIQGCIDSAIDKAKADWDVDLEPENLILTIYRKSRAILMREIGASITDPALNRTMWEHGLPTAFGTHFLGCRVRWPSTLRASWLPDQQCVCEPDMWDVSELVLRAAEQRFFMSKKGLLMDMSYRVLYVPGRWKTIFAHYIAGRLENKYSGARERIAAELMKSDLHSDGTWLKYREAAFYGASKMVYLPHNILLDQHIQAAYEGRPGFGPVCPAPCKTPEEFVKAEMLMAKVIDFGANPDHELVFGVHPRDLPYICELFGIEYDRTVPIHTFIGKIKERNQTALPFRATTGFYSDLELVAKEKDEQLFAPA